MQFVDGPPRTVAQHKPVLVLAAAVVTVQIHMRPTNSIVTEEMMQVADRCIAALTGWHSFINQIVDLLWNALTADAKQDTFLGGQETAGQRESGPAVDTTIIALIIIIHFHSRHNDSENMYLFNEGGQVTTFTCCARSKLSCILMSFVAG